MSSKKLVSRTTNDHYNMTHTRTTTSVYKDSNNQRYTVQDKTVSRASHKSSFNAMPRLTNGSSGTVAGPRGRTSFTQTSTTTYKGPGNEKMVISNRDYHSNIQKSSYHPGNQKAIGNGNYNNRGSGDVARRNGGGYYN